MPMVAHLSGAWHWDPARGAWSRATVLGATMRTIRVPLARSPDEHTGRVAEPIAIISIVSGAVVAITVPLISSALERRRLRSQLAESRIDELRVVLDEAAIALDRARTGLPTWEVLGQEQRNHVAAYADLRVALAAVGAQAERIAVRLGESSPLFTSYEHARVALTRLHHGLIAEEALRKIPGMIEAEAPRIDPQTDPDFVEGRRAFREAARKIVGLEVQQA